jgi:hypothetical protein
MGLDWPGSGKYNILHYGFHDAQHLGLKGNPGG